MLKQAIPAASFQQGGLQLYLNIGSLNDLPASSSVPDVIRHADWNQPSPEAAQALKDAGFSGMHGGDPQALAAFELGCSAGGEVREPGWLDEWAPKAKDMGFQAMTTHAGWGLESDEQIDRICEHIINTANKVDLPISIETHRATMMQDYERTLRLIERNPDIRFNGDFSHWFTGLEMVYGDFDAKLDALEPVFERVTHMHGRIGTPGCIQTPLQGHEDADYVDHFRNIWTRVFKAFRRQAAPDQILIFAPELLQPAIYYAPVDRNEEEMSDRWEDVQIMTKIAKECWEAAGK